MRIAHFFLLLLCLVAVLPAYAQEENGLFAPDTMPLSMSFVPKPTHFLELGISANSYSGDLSKYEKWTACYHAALRFNEAKRLNGRVGFSFGAITGDNRSYKFSDGKPNKFFRTSVFSLSYEVHYNFIKTPSFMLYGSIGLGIYNYQPKNEKGENYTNLLETRTLDENYGRVSTMLPVGIGANYILKNGYGIGVHASWLNTQTDYLDNISQWGTKKGNDNVASLRLYVYAPLQFSKPILTPGKIKKPNTYYTHEILK